MDEGVFEAIRKIVESGCEFEAIRILQKSIEDQFEKSEKACADYKARLRFIRKINNGQNEAIDEMSDYENDEEV